MSYKAITVVWAAIGSCAVGMSNAFAMNLSYEETSAGQTGTGAGTAYTSLPVSDNYGKTFSAPTQGNVPGTSSGFFDEYIFSVGGAQADAITSTINFANVLAINNLSVSLYSYNGNPASLPQLGAPNQVVGWSTTTTIAPGTQTTVNVLSDPSLAPGNYVLEVKGNVTGQSGGSYAGVLNLAPVPLPAALPLMLSGLGLLGGAARCRRRPALQS